MINKTKPDEETQDKVLELVGHKNIAPHILKGCEVLLCSNTGCIVHLCIPRCKNSKFLKSRACSPLSDTHLPLSRLMDYTIFTKDQKQAINMCLNNISKQEKNNARNDTRCS